MGKCRGLSNAVVHRREVADADNLDNGRPAIGENRWASWAYFERGIFDGKKAHLFGQRGRVNNNLLMLSEKKPNNSSIAEAVDKEQEGAQKIRRAELLALFRILVKEPPPGHDFRTCPICKEFGITSI